MFLFPLVGVFFLCVCVSVQIESGYRMPSPAGCPGEVYEIMQQCWQYNPADRPNFSTILKMLTQAEKNIKT